VPLPTNDSPTAGAGLGVDEADGEGMGLGVGPAVGVGSTVGAAAIGARLGVGDAAAPPRPVVSDAIAAIVNEPMSRHVMARPSLAGRRRWNAPATAALVPSIATVPRCLHVRIAGLQFYDRQLADRGAAGGPAIGFPWYHGCAAATRPVGRTIWR
jgi:hypothetical protein